MTESQAMNTEQAAAYLNLHPQTLKRWRRDGIGPRYFRVGMKKIFYRQKDIDSWVDTANIEQTETSQA